MAPKAEIKPEKKNKVDAVATELENASSVVFVDYTGMNVKMQEDFRNKLREVGGKMKIAKNTLIKLAGEKAKLPQEIIEENLLEGQTAMILSSEDAVSPIQILGKFVKEFELPKIKAGVVEGSFQDEAGIVKITKLPSKEQLSAQVIGATAAPMYGLVGTLQGNLNKLVWILKAKASA